VGAIYATSLIFPIRLQDLPGQAGTPAATSISVVPAEWKDDCYVRSP